MMPNLRSATSALLLLMLPAGPAAANDLVIWSGGAAKGAVSEVIAGFTRSTSQGAVPDYAPMGTLMKRLAVEAGGADIVVLSAEAMEEAVKKGYVMPDSITEVGRVGVGVAVNQNAAAPDISSADAFKATLLAAKSIVMIDPATGTSGKHLAEVFERLGIADQLKAKTTYLAGGYVVEPVGKGEIELGLHQISEILPVKGVKLVGPLPAELQKVTIYQAAITARPLNLEAARAFLDQVRAPGVRAAFARKGFMSQ